MWDQNENYKKDKKYNPFLKLTLQKKSLNEETLSS